MKTTWCAIFLVLGSVGLAFSVPDTGDTDKPAIAMVPVEADVHEFMEYAFEPFFHTLKSALEGAPADKNAWKSVKANALVLAENGNLLMLRGPEENSTAWNRLATEMRDQGKQLYQAAKKRDYSASRQQYERFVEKCNACHHEFADGEHLQKP